MLIIIEKYILGTRYPLTLVGLYTVPKDPVVREPIWLPVALSVHFYTCIFLNFAFKDLGT
jgi:hypothetical protein